MRKLFPLFLMTIGVFLFAFHFNIANAFLGRNSFGGKITHSVSIEIQQKQKMGYVCAVNGKTITIRPSGSYPSSYFIPIGIANRTGKIATAGKFILGLYKPTPTAITCTDSKSGATETVSLPTISMYGTS